MGVSKVVYDGQTIIDLTSDTVDQYTLLTGFTAHDKYGNVVHGRMVLMDTTGDPEHLPSRILSVQNETIIVGDVDTNGGYYCTEFGLFDPSNPDRIVDKG